MYRKKKNGEFLVNLSDVKVSESINDLSKLGFSVKENANGYEFIACNSVFKPFLGVNISTESTDLGTIIKLEVDELMGTNLEQCESLKRAFRKLEKTAKENILFDMIIEVIKNS